MADRYIVRTPLGLWNLVENGKVVLRGTKPDVRDELLVRNQRDSENRLAAARHSDMMRLSGRADKNGKRSK